MKEKTTILSYCHIRDNSVYLNGDVILLEDKTQGIPEFLKSIYKKLDINYPKFFKMDSLSKLSLLAAEVLLSQENASIEDKENMAIILSNKSASLDTDRVYQNSINDKENYYPSPAVFVYTLPNIGIGEITIKHKIRGESTFFVFDEFNPKLLKQYTDSLFSSKKCKTVLCGWIDVDNGHYDAYMYLASLNGKLLHTEENISSLYNLNS